MNKVMGGEGLPSFFTSPIRFVDQTLQVVGVNANYGTDFSMQIAFNNFESRMQISKDAGPTAGVWGIGGGAAPVGPDMPQWHESYPILNQGFLFEAAFMGTESWSGLIGGLNDFRWAGFTNPSIGDWRRMNQSFAVAAIVENPAGVVHNSEHVGIYEIRNFGDKVVVARARITLQVTYV